jgi:hypothetical protein
MAAVASASLAKSMKSMDLTSLQARKPGREEKRAFTEAPGTWRGREGRKRVGLGLLRVLWPPPA